MLDSGPATDRALRRDGDRRDVLTPIVALLLAPTIAYAGTRLGIELVNQAADATSGQAPTGSEAMIDAGQAQLLAVAVAVAALAYVAYSRVASLPVLASWTTAEPARPVSEVLAGLPDTYRVVAGSAVAGDGDLVDHVVIGPTGVYTIETRAYSCGVVIDRGHALVNGRNLDDLVEQVSRTAGSIGQRTRCPVTPVVCAHGGVRVDTFLGTPVVDGVRFCDEPDLVHTITAGRSVLSPGACDRIEIVMVDD